MAKLKDENLIHIKLTHKEAVSSKVDVLSTQMALIKILKTIKVFHKLRAEELKAKSKIQRKLKEINNNIHRLEVLLPEIKIPKILQHEQEEVREEVREKVREKNHPVQKKDPYDKDLEVQLKEIQEKLMKLE